ncbi:MAG: translation initiation factor IF-2 subunit alpha [Archaeoglobaceae archaeon]
MTTLAPIVIHSLPFYGTLAHASDEPELVIAKNGNPAQLLQAALNPLGGMGRFVKKGQKVVCKVLSVNPKRGHIDLSIKDVNERQKREKLQQWKNEMSAFKWLEIVGKKLQVSEEEVLKIGRKLLKEYDSVYSAFEEVATEGYEILAKLVGEEFAKAMAEIARENLKPKKVKVRGYFEIKFMQPDGVERIKKTFSELKLDENVGIEIYYVGAPKYRVVIEAEDYKVAENALKKVVTTVSKNVKKLGGECNFVREAI